MDAAVVTGISGFVVGALGIAFGAWTAHAQRAHDRWVAHNARLFEAQKEVYADLARVLMRWSRYLDRLDPRSGHEPDVTTLLPELEFFDLWARVSLVGSSRVIRGLETCEDVSNRFKRAVEEGASEAVVAALRAEAKRSFESITEWARADLTWEHGGTESRSGRWRRRLSPHRERTGGRPEPI
jgi:hypothetical protein